MWRFPRYPAPHRGLGPGRTWGHSSTSRVGTFPVLSPVGVEGQPCSNGVTEPTSETGPAPHCRHKRHSTRGRVEGSPKGGPWIPEVLEHQGTWPRTQVLPGTGSPDPRRDGVHPRKRPCLLWDGGSSRNDRGNGLLRALTQEGPAPVLWGHLVLESSVPPDAKDRLWKSTRVGAQERSAGSREGTGTPLPVDTEPRTG